MGGKSKSSSHQESSQVEQNFNFVEGGGDGDRMNFALSEGASVGNVSVQQTDYGAIAAAQELNKGALDLGMTATEEAFATANNFGALSFGALKENNDFAKSVATDSLAQAIGGITKQAEFSQKQTADTIERAFNLSMLNSRSEGEAVTTEGIKALTIVGGLAASGFIIASLVKARKGKG
ncbi:hypothetical protein [Microbulbifer taiwanensis]|uniref:Uncharacterized protein n=1 Tax=Microbulbifer taiwanensis TaxID=986746 RepID=A0ABW1YSV7_9GAMM|nr:hypothetical protein [Microbulbifer taiwanensis]